MIDELSYVGHKFQHPNEEHTGGTPSMHQCDLCGATVLTDVCR